MTTQVNARRDIYNYFLNQWGATTPVDLENEPFEVPDVNTTDAWVRMVVRHTSSAQESLGRIGNRRYRRLGNVITQVFTRSGGGLLLADTRAQQVRDVFEGVRTGEISFFDVQISEGPTDGVWLMMIVQAAFDYIDIK